MVDRMMENIDNLVGMVEVGVGENGVVVLGVDLILDIIYLVEKKLKNMEVVLLIILINFFFMVEIIFYYLIIESIFVFIENKE